MTTPQERTRAVIGARDLLVTLAHGRGPYCADLVRTLAYVLLRHYPLDVDLDVSAIAVPTVWSSCGVAEPRQHIPDRKS